jgi:NAD(P)-dependent dehydrogenase (short-subunit alcohol dehydrogenase family)
LTISAQGHPLAGRTALITGASSGLGAHFARLFAAAGANVVLAARRQDRLIALAAEIEASGGRALAVALDVADEPSTLAAYDAAQQAFGVVDTIVANAGVGPSALAVDMPIEQLDETYAINVRGAFLTAREGARRLLTAGPETSARGRIVIVSSVTATTISARLGAYAASKAAVLHLGRHLAREWLKDGINVNVIQPGYLRTELTDDWFSSEGGSAHVASWPRRRLMEAEDMDGLMLFLASTESRSVTGATFVVDDGQLL